MGAEEQIAEALRPAVQAAGLEIWDVERSGATVRVLVEGPGGVDLESISRVTSAISATLDQHDELVPGGRYMLEVSSPGLERRLRYPGHFARYVGEEVTVKTVEPVNDTRRLRGTLTSASADDITLRVNTSADETSEIRVPMASVERANTVFEWGSSQKGPKTKTSSGKSAKGHRKASAGVDNSNTKAAGEAIC
ncbi:MAG TPA: ribosome maturation factor RimP [Acidimicrobiales bacterium]|nr:ribosome maturation factor RimP [Acidimicrobiales bacterium]